jgi:hypothetical protein
MPNTKKKSTAANKHRWESLAAYQPVIVKKDIMRTKKETRFLLPGVRRLVASVLHYAATLANAHPLVIVTTPPREKYHARGIQPTRD